MARDATIHLNDRWQKFIDKRISAGRFDSVDDALAAGLRLLELEERKFERLMAFLEEGEASGPAVPWDVEAFLAEERETDRLDEAA